MRGTGFRAKVEAACILPHEPFGEVTAMSAETVDPAAGPAAALSRALRSPLALGALGVAVVVAAWQAASALELVARESLPAPMTVAARVKDLLVSTDFQLQVLDTVWTWLLSMAVTVAVAVPLGIVLGTVAALYRPTV